MANNAANASNPDWETPIKAKVQGAVEYNRAKGITGENEAIFRYFGVSHARGWAMLNNNPWRHHNNPEKEENRGPKRLITPKEIRELERIVEEDGFEARAMTWEQLAFEANLDVSGRTVQRAMGTIKYHKCIACRKGWVNESTAKHRVNWAEYCLRKYPAKEDWHRVRFSDEVH